MNRIRWYGPTVVLLITLIVVMIAGPRMTQQLAHTYKSAELQLVRDDLRGNGTLADLSDSFRKVAQIVGPSVVHIQVSSKGRPRMLDQFKGLRPFHRFFSPDDGDDKNDGDDEGMEQFDVPMPAATGSGWVFSDDGYIVTNNHVITTDRRNSQVADKIEVRFDDGSKYDAVVVGRDPKTDIAVLKVDGGSFHKAKLTQSPPEQGGIVFAFGSPFGYKFSMSQGIVSATGREVGILRMERGYENFIQTDAAINRGNSGGPLANIYGEVIGMNTVIASSTGQSAGLGFAIPADQIRHVVEQLIEKGEVERGFLGIMIDTLDPKMARTFSFKGKGVLVIEPLQDTPAAKSGIQTGDIITKVDGRKVASASDLRFLVADMRPGTKVKLEVYRGGKTFTKTIQLARLPDSDRIARARDDVEQEDDGEEQDEGRKLLNKLGLTGVNTLTEETARKLRMPYVEGVIVNRVRFGSVARSNGINRRTIITHVMDDRVRSVADLTDALQRYDLSQGVRLQVKQPHPRDREKLVPGFVLLELPK